jgi:septum formation protein
MHTTPVKWVLASASPRRKEMLSNIGLQFDVVPSRIPEPSPDKGERPDRYAVRVARLKAAEVSRNLASPVVISADTIVVLGSKVLGKPGSKAEGREMLSGLSGRWHEVVTGLCLTDTGTGRRRSAATKSRVHFRRLSRREIEWYLATGEYADKAGAYAIQGYGSLFIDRIEGCYFNVVGFPIYSFERLVRALDVDLLKELG